jgi:hypothetical protein
MYHVVVREWKDLSNLNYNRITSTKSPSFCMTTFNASPTNILPQSIDCRYYVSRRLLTCPLLCLQGHTDLCAHDFAHFSYLWHQLGSLTLLAPEAGVLVELIFQYFPAFDWRGPEIARSLSPTTHLPPPLRLFCVSLRDSNLTQRLVPFQSCSVCCS